MPANVIDTVGFKTAFHRTVRDRRFTTARLVEAINEVMAEDAQARAGTGEQNAPPRLTQLEEIVYGQIAAQVKEASEDRPLDWMKVRGESGPGRVDAFGALRFEQLNYSETADEEQAAQGRLLNTGVDRPSVGNKRADYRPWHHWDGNTGDSRARNFGAVVG